MRGNAGGIPRVIEAAASAAGDVLQHGLVGPVAHAHRRDGDAGGYGGIDQVGDLFVGGLPVGQEDDVLFAGGRGDQLFDRLAQAGQDVRASARLNARDVGQDLLAVRGALQAHHRAGRGVENDHRDLIGRRERLCGGARGVLREIHLGARHRARFVDDQREGDRGLLASIGDVEAHGQELFETGPGVTARTKALRTPTDEQPAALTHESFQPGGRGLGKLAVRDVGEHDQIRSGEVRSTQAALGGANFCFDVFGGEDARQHGRAAGRAFEAEHARLAFRGDGQNPLIVFRVKVAFREDVGAEAGDARFGDTSGGGQGRLAGGERHRPIRFVDERVPV